MSFEINIFINSKGEIVIDPLDQEVDPGDEVIFKTDEKLIIFKVSIDNSNQFFDDTVGLLEHEVSQSQSQTYTVNNPNRTTNLAKFYSVEVKKVIIPTITKVAPKIILRP